VDVALDNGFTSLATAVITAELLPALSDPLASFTVFAPTNTAFENLATALGTNVAGLLSLPNLADVLTYHVLGSEVMAANVTNGAIVQPLSATNTLKMTVTSTGNVFVNQAEVVLTDVMADNGVVHVLNAVVLPAETVVDVALDNGFTTLATAVVSEELLPILTNPLASFTVFAPTNAAFDSLAADLGTDINGILALPNLTEVLTYHVLATEVLSTQLVAGPVATVNGASVNVSLMNGVMINDANVTLADVLSDNGVVHVIDRVLLPTSNNVNNESEMNISIYPNPAVEFITINTSSPVNFTIYDMSGRLMESGRAMNGQSLSVHHLPSGLYLMQLTGDAGMENITIVKQ
jgi:transforming growth factor-beta-induced protein